MYKRQKLDNIQDLPSIIRKALEIKPKIDDLDRKILNYLQQDARIAASHIADELNISIPTVTDRIKKLTEVG